MLSYGGPGEGEWRFDAEVGKGEDYVLGAIEKARLGLRWNFVPRGVRAEV